MNVRLLTLLLALFLPSTSAAAQLGGASPETVDAGIRDGDLTARIAFDQRIGASLPTDGRFLDHTGATWSLADLDRDQACLLVPVYFGCPRLCGLVLDGVVRTLRTMKLEPGRDFELVAFSIDPRETPEDATHSREHFLTIYDRAHTEPGWHFLTTSDEQAIEELAASIGFGYAYDATRDEYAHAAGIVVANTEDTVSHYFYGVEYPARQLRMALVEASQGKVGSLVDKVLLFCFHYDPSTGRYGLVIMNVLRIGGVLTVLVLAGSLILMSRRGRRLDPMVEGAR